MTRSIFKNALAPSSLRNPPRIIFKRDFRSPLYLSIALLLCSNPYLRQAIGTPAISLVTHLLVCDACAQNHQVPQMLNGIHYNDTVVLNQSYCIAYLA